MANRRKTPTDGTTQNDHIQAGLYVRVSTDAQAEEGYSIDAQRSMLEAYCKSRDIKNYSFYIDGGYTGSNIDRPELQRLVHDIKHNKINLVVVYKLDRLSRSQRDTLYLIEDVFNRHNTGFVSLQESIDTSTPMGRAIIGILSAFAQLERETIHERTKMGMLERVKLGYWPGGARTPYGYTYNTETGILEHNEDTKKLLMMRDLLFQGYSPEAIARMMGYKYDTTVRNALRRRTNLGLIVYDGVTYKGLHKPIFSQEDYQKIMAILAARGAPGQRSDGYLLSGLMECGICHAKMRYQKWGKGLKIYCYSQQKSKKYLVKDPDCNNERLDAEDVEEVVLNALFSHNIQIEDAQENDDEMQSPLAVMKGQYDALSGKLKRLYGLYAEGDDALLDVINELKKELAGLQSRIELEEFYMSQADQPSNNDPIDLSTLKAMWPQMPPHEQRAAIRDCINKITITGTRIDIDFKF